jgi:hypothetical protein
MSAKMSNKTRKKTLKSARQCRKFLSKVINELYQGEIETDVAGKIFYGVSVLLKSIETDELERRIIKLEELTNGTTKTFTSYTN